MATIKFRWSVTELANVMTLYDTQKVYRSTTGISGTYTEITALATRVPLVANTYQYYFDDTTGASTYYYRSSYFHTTNLIESDQSDPVKAGLDANYLVLQDLYNLVGTERVKQFFDDDIDDNIADESNQVNAILIAAEAEAATHMMRSWNVDQITDLANNDGAFKNHVAWVALELASERRPEFTAADGKGMFWAQYERAINYFKALSKGNTRSPGESVAGVGGNIGGQVNPPKTTSPQPRFIFARDKDAPTGHGGF